MNSRDYINEHYDEQDEQFWQQVWDDEQGEYENQGRRVDE